MMYEYRFRAAAIFLVLLQISSISLGYYFYSSFQNELSLTKKELQTLEASSISQFSQNENIQTIKNDDTKKEVLAKVPSFDSFAPSVVKLVCRTSDVQSKQGSGVLFKKEGKHDISSYYIKTNLHVVLTEDRSPSHCEVFLYPNYADSLNYLTFESTGHEYYSAKMDIAYIKPELTRNFGAGSLDDLKRFAQSEIKSPICSSVNIGERLLILGYPSVGGDSLTITEGIVSGFEFADGIRFIKTSAKIDHGNSGGVAIKESGCTIGIPTFSQEGKLESIGRILDLNYISSIENEIGARVSSARN